MPATRHKPNTAGDVWILHQDQALRNRMAALHLRLRPLQDWSDLAEVFGGAAGHGLVVVDPYHACTNGGPHPQLSTFLESFPSAVVVAAVDSGLDRAADVRVMGEWGVAGVIALDFDTSDHALLRRMEEARERSALNAILQDFPDVLSADARLLLESALATASWGGRVTDFARSVHLSERTLQRRIERARLPAPRSLLRWMRLLLAARLLDDPGRTVVSAAFAAGYASDASLHRNFRISGMPSPATLRREGALRAAVRHFVATIARDV